MLPYVHVFGHEVMMYLVFQVVDYASVPIIMILLRKRYGYKIWQAFLYSLFTLFCGTVAMVITTNIANYLMVLTSNGAFEPYEQTSSYGIPFFLPVLFLVYCLLFRVSFKKLTDYVAPCICFVEIFGKVACAFNGCCYGIPSAHGIMTEAGYIGFPVALYDAGFNAIFFIFVMIGTYTFSKKRPGYLLPIYGMLYAIQKGCLEEFRVYSTEWEGNFLNTGRTYWQYFLFFMFVGCLIWLILTIVRDKKEKPDFDTAENIKLPDLSKPKENFTKVKDAVLKVKDNYQEKRRAKRREINNYTHHKKKPKKNKK